MTNAKEPAYPVPDTVIDDKSFLPEYKGLTKREYVAIHILAGLLSRDSYQGGWSGQKGVSRAVKFSIEYADELLNQANKEQQ